MKPFWRSVGVIDRVSVAVLGLCVIEVCLVALTIWSAADYRSTLDHRSEARKTRIASDSAFIALLDAETGQHGYLLTGASQFLEPYNQGLQRLDESLAELGWRVAGEPLWENYYNRLLSLAGQKRADLANTISLRDQGQSADQISSAISTGASKELTDEFRQATTALQAEVTSEIASTDSRASDRRVFATVISSALAVVTLGLVIALAYTMRRRADTESLRRAGTAKDEFVGFVSHELRAPIALIAGNAHQIALNLDGDHPERAECVAEIVLASERLEAIVGTLLSLAKAEAGGQLAVEPVLAHRVAAAVLRHHGSLFPDRQVNLVVAPGIPPVLGDRAAIEQVLVNLLQNAERYGHASAPITVEIAETPPAAVLVSVLNEGGILDGTQFSHVFEPFFRMSSTAQAAEGIGLGLTICHRLISAQGGAMIAEPQPGGGARFSFRLPIAAELAD